MKVLRLVIFFVVLFILFRFVFVFRKITCKSDSVSIENGVCDLINNNFHGKSLFFTDFENDQIWDDLLIVEQYGQVYQYQRINKSIFGGAELFLIAKLPDYRLIIGQERFLLNQNNRLKNDQDRLILPSIEFTGDDSIKDNGYLQEDHHQKFLALSRALIKYQIETNKIIWQNDQEIHLMLKKIEVIIDNSRDFDKQIERLSLILKEEELKEILPSKRILDMRFNLPVLKDF